MTNKPKMKREVAVVDFIKGQRIIYFYATADAITQFETFGDVYQKGLRKQYIVVDARYNFDEVLAWLEGYGN